MCGHRRNATARADQIDLEKGPPGENAHNPVTAVNLQDFRDSSEESAWSDWLNLAATIPSALIPELDQLDFCAAAGEYTNGLLRLAESAAGRWWGAEQGQPS
jgi:hypothetical protein